MLLAGVLGDRYTLLLMGSREREVLPGSGLHQGDVMKASPARVPSTMAPLAIFLTGAGREPWTMASAGTACLSRETIPLAQLRLPGGLLKRSCDTCYLCFGVVVAVL